MRIAIYVRVSTQQQAQTQTIEQQLEKLQRYFEQKNWRWEERNIFRDEGYSGASLNRPGLDRLREQVANAQFDRVLMTNPDRLARKYIHQMMLIEELEKGGCQVEFVERPMSQEPDDQLLLQIRGAVSEYERSLITERMRRGRQHKYRSGNLLPWTCPPYGYRVNPDRPRDPKGVQLDEAETAIVTQIYGWYLEEDGTLAGVAKRLMAHNIPAPAGGKRWSCATVHCILTNPVYTGNIWAGRGRVRPIKQRHSPLDTALGKKPNNGKGLNPEEDWILVAQIPALISEEQFELVKTKLGHNLQFSKRNNKAHNYLLRGLVSCGLCKMACCGTTRKPYSYYFCRGKLHPVYSNRDEKCPSRLIPMSQLDEVVWADLCEVMRHPESIKLALARSQGGYWLPQELTSRREKLRRAQASLTNQIERLTEAYLQQIISLAEYGRRRKDLEERLEGLGEQVRQLAASVKREEELSGLTNHLEEFASRVQKGLEEASFSQKRQLIELLIDRIVVTNEEVEIRYVIPLSPASEQVKFCHLRSIYLRTAA